MFSTAYLPHVLYSLALTSISIHLLRQRNDAETTRAQVAAQISILEDTAARLRSGEAIPERELERLRKLARTQREPGALTPPEQGEQKEEIGWREVLLGRKQGPVDGAAKARAEEWDRRDLERARREVGEDAKS